MKRRHANAALQPNVPQPVTLSRDAFFELQRSAEAAVLIRDTFAQLDVAHQHLQQAGAIVQRAAKLAKDTQDRLMTKHGLSPDVPYEADAETLTWTPVS